MRDYGSGCSRENGIRGENKTAGRWTKRSLHYEFRKVIH